MMKSQLTVTCTLAAFLLVGCASAPAPVVVPIKPQAPAALMRRCPPLPAPSGDTLGDMLKDESAVIDLYGVCAKRVSDWINWVNQ